MTKNKAEKEISNEEKLFIHSPIWKSVLKMALPSMVLMFVFGSYFFFDSVLSINLANDSYDDGVLKATDQVRLFMNGYSPINSLMIAVSLLIGMGISTRVSINLGAKRKERALGTIKTGNMIGVSLALIMVPILIFSAKPWIASQYDGSISTLVSNEAFKYAWPVIMSFPFTVFNQVLSSLLRVEARNKQMLIALVTPIFINLFGDWLFMGPMGMGVEGGAWATFISTIITTLIFIFFILRTPESIILFKNLFGFKFRVLSIVGIILVGLSPFLRNMAQSITSTAQMSIVKDVSRQIYNGKIHGTPSDVSLMHMLMQLKANGTGLPTTVSTELNTLFNGYNISSLKPIDVHNILTTYKGPGFLHLNGFIKTIYDQNLAANFMTIVITGAIPVYVLFFPILFAFAQAARPIASYNYGAKKYDRVKQVYWWTTLYALIAGILIYFVVAWGLSGPLMNLLNVDGQAYDVAKKAIRIIMLTMVFFSFAIPGMVVLGSTDRILFSILASSLQGLILFWPVMFGMKEIALNHVESEYLFWWAWPILGGLSSIFVSAMAAIVMNRLPKKKQITLDERILKINNWFSSKTKKGKKKLTK